MEDSGNYYRGARPLPVFIRVSSVLHPWLCFPYEGADMSWLVDNAITLSILLGLVAAALVLIWRSNRQNKYLGYAAGAGVLIGLIWLLGSFHISDSKQIENNVNEMRAAVIAGKVDDLFQHVSEEFVYEGRAGKMTRKMLYESARQSIKAAKVGDMNITGFKVIEISRANKLARVSFKVTAFFGAEQQPFPFNTKAEFVLEGQKWKLKTMEFYKSGVNTDEKLDLIP